jgi:hypothetical protein
LPKAKVTSTKKELQAFPKRCLIVRNVKIAELRATGPQLKLHLLAAFMASVEAAPLSRRAWRKSASADNDCRRLHGF